jgi:hypothetical protein
MSTKEKTAEEWLLHLPPDCQEKLKKVRNELWGDDENHWQRKYNSLWAMLWVSLTPKEELNPFWIELYKKIDAGEFNKPCSNVTKLQDEVSNIENNIELSVYDKFPVGSEWVLKVKVIKHDLEYTQFPIKIVHSATGREEWLNVSQLENLNPLI